MTRDDAEQTYLNRRSVIAASGAVGVAGLAGCTGDGGQSDPENGGTQGSDQGDEEFDHPDFVMAADSAFGRMETDWEEGIVTTEIREDVFDDDEELDELAVVFDGEDIETGAPSSTVDLPCAGWYDVDGNGNYTPIYGDVTVEIRNDFGDVLAEMEWELETDLSVEEVARAGDADVGSDIHEDALYVRIENGGHVGYLTGVDTVIPTHGVDMEIDEFQSAGSENQLAHADDRVASFDAMFGSGTTEMIVGGSNFPMFDGSGYAIPNDLTCDAEGEGELVFQFVQDDIDVSLDITTDGEVDHENGNCPGTEVSISG